MPPSPALRYSPGRELRADGHKRGQSLEGGLYLREKDDDLALFNEMQSRERENFLLQSSDDLEDTISSKLRHFSDFKLGISIPARGENSDLLNADGEKNDYDWLLTPPDTPLFPSLDDEPSPVNVASRGRARSKPISISRSSTMETSYRSSRGSASPNRLSPSPRSGSNSFQSRGRPSSAPHSSPTPSLRYATPSRRPSPPPSKPSTPAPRSSTPTPRRMSTGSSGSIVSTGTRGTSPVKTSRGNSASPKIRAWQTNIPGFSSEAPPNLRTSLADRPASYVRGSSPASRNGRDSTSKFSRKSMSPTASKSGSSFHSHDRDRLSSHSKGSVASSGDDDVDSLQSIPIGSLDRLASRGIGSYSNNKALTFSKKSARTVSSSSAPKRSFDSALRHMDRKSPQNMFRPLLSSVPSTTFYVGKANAAYRPFISRNSSVTSSSNASSNQGKSFALDTDGSDYNQDDIRSESEKVTCPDFREEVFVLDKMDVVNETIGCRIDGESIDNEHGEFCQGVKTESGSVYSEDLIDNCVDTQIKETSETYHVKDGISETGAIENATFCSKCGCRYEATDQAERDIRLCPECCIKETVLRFMIPEETSLVCENSQENSLNALREGEPSAEMEPLVHELSQDASEGRSSTIHLSGETCCNELIEDQTEQDPVRKSSVEEGEQILANQREITHPSFGYSLLDNNTGNEQLDCSVDQPNFKVDISEGAGISLLLKGSSSSKAPVIQGRTFTATPLHFDDVPFKRDSANSTRSSISHCDFSASSSIDFSSARQSEFHVQRQLSARKLDVDLCGHDTSVKPCSIDSSSSGTPNHSHQGLGLAASVQEDSSGYKEDRGGEATMCSQELPDSQYVVKDSMDASYMGSIDVKEDKSGYSGNGRHIDACGSDLSTQVVGTWSEDNSEASLPNCDDNSYGENGEILPNNSRGISNVEVSVTCSSSSINEEYDMQNSAADGVDSVMDATSSSLIIDSERDRENCIKNQNNVDPLNHNPPPSLKCTVDDFQEPAVPNPSDCNLTGSGLESTSEPSHDILEESTIMVEGLGGSRARSLTLEEATDTILFCNSIVHDLAYRAATLAMEKEKSAPLEEYRPVMTILPKTNSARKESRNRSAGKHKIKPQKARVKRVETDMKPLPGKTENDENIDESLIRNVGLPNKVDGMKPTPKLESKCNCSIM